MMVGIPLNKETKPKYIYTHSKTISIGCDEHSHSLFNGIATFVSYLMLKPSL